MPRRAFTLMELLLVIALVVAVGALVLPALANTMQNRQLKLSGEQVRSEFAKARVKAMRTGRIQVFRYELAGDRFLIEPWFAEGEELETSAEAMPAGRGSPGQNMAGQRTTGPRRQPTGGNASLGGGSEVNDGTRRLPDGVLFIHGASTDDPRTRAVEVNLDEPLVAQRGLDEMATMWSRPILFYTDGTSSEAEVLLKNRRNYFVRVELRGITGIARASDLLTVEELLAMEPQGGAP